MSKPTITKYELTELEISVLNHLKTGHDKATPLREFCLKTGIHERKLRMAIESLRRQGWAVLIPASKPFGYFLAQDRAELDEYTNYMRHRLIEEYHTYKSVKKATLTKINKEFGQLPLNI
jgi:hypothetical protein